MTPLFGEPSPQTGIATQGQIAPGDSNVGFTPIEHVSVSALTYSRLLPASLSELVISPNANKTAIKN